MTSVSERSSQVSQWTRPPSSTDYPIEWARDGDFPDDWIFGGANGKHPGADRRFFPNTYQYRDAMLRAICITQEPWTDEQAFEHFAVIAQRYPKTPPVFIEVKRPWASESEYELLPVEYDVETNTYKTND